MLECSFCPRLVCISCIVVPLDLLGKDAHFMCLCCHGEILGKDRKYFVSFNIALQIPKS
jgi:hypothetical protein